MHNLNKHKYIVHSGCSYGRLGLSLFENFELIYHGYGKILNDNISVNKFVESPNTILINVAISSQGSDWQSDSTIYVVKKLLELGVKSENIYAVVEWSQWHRNYQPLPKILINDILKKDINKLQIKVDEREPSIMALNKTKEEYDVCNLLSEKLKIGKLENKPSLSAHIGYIEDSFYLTPTHVDRTNIKNQAILNWLDLSKEIVDREFEDTIIRRYLNNIIRTQNYLKINNIDYNFFHMQGCLTNWEENNDVYQHKLTHDVSDVNSPYLFKDYKIIKNPNYKPQNKVETDIENVYTKYKFLFEQLDLKNFWFYENEKYRRGGIDEWVIDKFSPCGFVSINDSFIKDGYIDLPTYGMHPIEFLYHLKWNEIATNCKFLKLTDEYLKYIFNLIEEDYNSDSMTVNGLMISKKYFEQKTK